MSKFLFYAAWAILVFFALMSLISTSLFTYQGFRNEVPLQLICGFVMITMAMSARRIRNAFKNSICTPNQKLFSKG
jgi:hypothetical protein